MDVGGPSRNDAKLDGNRMDVVRLDGNEESPSKASVPTPSAIENDVLELVHRLRQLPEVREEIVQASIAKLSRGEFTNRESAERTAEAILKTFDKE